MALETKAEADVEVPNDGRTASDSAATAAGDHHLGEGGRMVTVRALHVSRNIRETLLGGKVGLKLMRMAADWAKAQGAAERRIHLTSGTAPERTDKLMKRRGFTADGGNYAGTVL